MKIIADENMPLVDEFFASHGDVVKLPGRTMTPDQVADADVLLVRSVTQINEALLADSGVQFVGTATIGEDHIDRDYLAKRGIGFASAPGCNAIGVVDYILSCLAQLFQYEPAGFLDKTVGIVGAGNVGGLLWRRLTALGVTCLVSDPPLQDAGMENLCGFEQVLAADVVSLHTPLTRQGPHPTWHLLDAIGLQALRPGTVLINSGRGEVVDNLAVKQRLATTQDLTVILDVWENEPTIDTELLPVAGLGDTAYRRL